MKQILANWFSVLILVLGVATPIAAQSTTESEPPYDLGPLPDGFAVEWPAPPALANSAEVRTAAEFNQAAATSGTAIVVKAPIIEPVQITASDIEVEMDSGASVGALTIAKEVKRVHLVGGLYTGGIEFSLPATFYPAHVEDEAWAVEDVLVEGAEVRSSPTQSAMLLRGNRIAIVRCTMRGGEYAIYSNTIEAAQNRDLIIAGNDLASEGDQATVRLVGVRDVVTVDNRLENLLLTGQKHTFRVHHASDQVYVARNLLVNGGTMFGTMQPDDIGEIWFEDNVFHHVTEDLFHPEPSRVAILHANNNVAYSARPCFLCLNPLPGQWEAADNELLPYEPAPTR